MIAVIDYGVGNLFSLKSSFAMINEKVIITSNKEEIKKADKIILPGVGAFRDAIKKLQETGLDKLVIEEANSGKPLMGICLGMQLLFDKSFEYGEYNGLGLIKGEVVPIKEDVKHFIKVPHMGWNSLIFKQKDNRLFKYINDGDYVYFVHSYFATGCDENVVATTEYGQELTAVVCKNNIYGCQFHPEKSGETGLKILKAFCEI